MRNEIIAQIELALKPLPFVNALWLEGADAANAVDEYSDIDFWVDIDDDFDEQAYEAVENALARLAPIDYKYIMNHGHPKIRQRIYHLAGTSEYLAIDFCWQFRSRPRDEYAYYENCSIEGVKILFDKIGVIRYRPMNPSDFAGYNQQRLDEMKYRRTQHARAEKYLHRGLFLEAYAYYNRYALEPLISLLRLIYTPAYIDHHLIHISRHIPEVRRQKLEYFAQISGLEDMATKMPQAAKWFDELLTEIEKQET
jgi:hypothetical protein